MLFSSSVIGPSQKKDPGRVSKKADNKKIDRLIKAIPAITLFLNFSLILPNFSYRSFKVQTINSRFG